LFENAKKIFFDVEKVDLSGSHTKGAATIACVNEQGKLIFWAKVNHSAVCKYYPAITALSQKLLSQGINPQMVIIV